MDDLDVIDHPTRTLAPACHPAAMNSPRRVVIIVSCIAVSVFALCGLGAAALVWAALNTPTPVEQQVGEAGPAQTTMEPPRTSSAAASSPAQTLAPQPSITAPGFDRAAWDTYWATFAQTSYGRHVTDVTWNGIAFIAHTDLVADSDARTPATQICMTASGFWGPGFRPVQVYDRNETVLVSRRSQGEACEWRR